MAARSVPSPRDPRLKTWRTFLYAHAQVRRQLERELQAEQSMGLADYELLLVLAYSPQRRLRMSEPTMKTYVSRILTKLDCANRVQAALLVRDTGLPRATEAPGTGTG